MADTGILATTAQVQAKVGAGASSTYNAEAYINIYIAQAEARINVESEYNWCDAYSGLNTDVKGILTEAASNLAAMYVIQADPTAMSLETATYKLNVLYTGYMDSIKLLRETDKGAIFVQEA